MPSYYTFLLTFSAGAVFAIVVSQILRSISFETSESSSAFGFPNNKNEEISTKESKIKGKTARINNEVPHGFCRTSSTGYEIVLESLLGSLLAESNLIPPGDILDVGAQFGEQACHFATLAPERSVYALDPSPEQANGIVKKFGAHLSNLIVINAGIGRTVGNGTADTSFTGMKVGDTFLIETIDHLFHDSGRALGFAHIDVEGVELDVLQGGSKTIQENHPIFTVEVRVHKDPNYTIALLDLIDEYGYDSYVIDEPCGWPHMDYRNLICFPRFMGEKLVHSDSFNLAASTEAIFRVDRDSIFQKVYPECKLGGKFCNFDSTMNKQCCHENAMRQWHESSCKKPIAMQGFTYSKRATHRLWQQLKTRSKIG